MSDVIEVNVQTGEVIVREYTQEEIDYQEKIKQDILARFPGILNPPSEE